MDELDEPLASDRRGLREQKGYCPGNKPTVGLPFGNRFARRAPSAKARTEQALAEGSAAHGLASACTGEEVSQ